MASKNSKVSGPKQTFMYVVWKISVLYLRAFGFERLCFPFSLPAVQAPCCSVSLLLCSVPPSGAVLQPGHRKGHGAGLGAAELGSTAPNQCRWGSCLQLIVPCSERDGGRAYGHAELCSALTFARGQEGFL